MKATKFFQVWSAARIIGNNARNAALVQHLVKPFTLGNDVTACNLHIQA